MQRVCRRVDETRVLSSPSVPSCFNWCGLSFHEVKHLQLAVE